MAEKPVYPFIIVLRNETSRYVNITGFLLVFASAILFLRELLLRNTMVLPYLIGIFFIAGLLLWNGYRYFIKEQDIYYSKALMIAGLVWTRMPYFEWLVIVFAVMALLEYQAKLSPEVGFSTQHIVFNRLIRKKYLWNEIENVILKDDLLTIDFRNNKLFQKDIDSGENEASEKEFNDWIGQQLHPNPLFS